MQREPNVVCSLQIWVPVQADGQQKKRRARFDDEKQSQVHYEYSYSKQIQAIVPESCLVFVANNREIMYVLKL